VIGALPSPLEGPLLRALVVEDEWPARNYLVELVEGSRLAEVVGAVADAAQARDVLAASPEVHVDVVFVDVQLGGVGGERAGLDLVRAFSQPRGPAFVLATAFDHHALEAFELGVVDYLHKPFSEERVAQCLRRVRQRAPASAHAASAPPRIVARRKKSLIFLEPKEIWAFEAADRMTFVHTMHGTFDLDLSLAAIETSFGRAFARVHRNWLVNAAYIKELERDGAETHLFVGQGLGEDGRGVRVPVSRDRAQPLREMLLANATGLRRG
jgi:DNA-binding LytR/AlgR family response regulator